MPAWAGAASMSFACVMPVEGLQALAALVLIPPHCCCHAPLPPPQEYVRARIQRQLGRLQRPDYIQSLEVVGVDCGGVAPTLRNLRALPQPGAAIWPQLLFDMRYQGGLGGGQGG